MVWCPSGGRDASSFVLVSAGTIILCLGDTWCLGKGHTDSDPAPLMVGQHAPSLGYTTFHFTRSRPLVYYLLKRLIFPTIDLVFEPPVVDAC